MRVFNIDKGLVQVIQKLYRNASSAVLLNGQKGTSSGHQWASVRVVCSHPSCSTFFLRG
ncbi:hypothetical protein DPMN_076067 [Dreissena polymorpha]|uniref:Uncharacterized protein n=1 Tax=Dreissena polymorpha TaxID=45954 RepID=A0A9D3YN11_DREPO|nr:hypothetical protein DPMN_076067 [Dreissena polymorpha]